MEIKNITDFVDVFPLGSVIEGRTEYHSPCPFCKGGLSVPVTVHNNFAFWGTDRLVWRLDDNSFWCRVCSREGRGHNGNYFAWEMAHLFSLAFDPLLTEPVKPKGDTPLAYWTYGQVLTAHANVQRDFWYKFGWTDEVINHFKLGYGTLYQQDGAVNLIPTSVRTPQTPPTRDLYYMAGRREDLPARRAFGSISNFFWFIHEDRECKTVAFAEGEKDAITLWFLGYKNIAVTFGSANWSSAKTKFLADMGFTEIISFGDNDEAGLSLNTRITEWGKSFGLNVKCLSWDSDIPKKFDVTDQLSILGKDQLNQYIETHLITLEVELTPQRERPSYIPDYSSINPHYKIPEIFPTSLTELRGDGKKSIQFNINSFLTSYNERKRRGRGLLKLLYVPPGGGKTHALVRTSEKIALESQEKAYAQKFLLKQELVETKKIFESGEYNEEDKDELKLLIAHLENKLETFSHASVLIATQFKSGHDDIIAAGANANLFYDYQARSADNCQNFDVVVELGKKNHNIGMFCNTGCPFANACRESGYLAQERKRRQKPITIVRHQHLLNPVLLDEYRDLIIIDESPFHVLEAPLIVQSTDIVPHVNEWSTSIGNEVSVDAIEALADALRMVLNTNTGQKQTLPDGANNPLYCISGASFLLLLDNHIRSVSKGKTNLEVVISNIDYKMINENYQPTFKIGKVENIQLRCFGAIYKAIVNEIKNFSASEVNTLPSCLHLVSGRLEVYPMEHIQISSNTPVIVADATAMIPELYDAAFGRELDIFAPQILNPNAETIVVWGSDWTLGQIEANIGKELRDRNKRLTTTVRDLSGNFFNLDEIPTNPNLYNSSLVRDYLDTIFALAERHNSLLVVTHKRVRGVIEDVIKHSYPKIYTKLAFGHYGALRGTNAFKHFEAVVLIGVSRIPYDVMWRKIQAWANLLQIGEPVPYTMSYFASPYHMQNTGHSYYTFEHQFARRYADMVEAGEMIQCAERIRPHSSDGKKTVYVCSSRPNANFVTRTITKTELLNFYRGDSKINRIKDFMIDYYQKCKKFPTKDDIMKRFACAYPTYKQARDLAQERLND